MKKALYTLVLVVLLASWCVSIAPAQATQPAVTITENYYKCIPGRQQEFLRLFMKNHWPLLEESLKSGRLVSIKLETPSAYMPEDVRWDYRVTIRSTGSPAQNTAEEAATKKRLFPDQDTFQREEKQRFDAVLAHWDITLTDLTPPADKK